MDRCAYFFRAWKALLKDEHLHLLKEAGLAVQGRISRLEHNFIVHHKRFLTCNAVRAYVDNIDVI